jgi:hypothetical protein
MLKAFEAKGRREAARWTEYEFTAWVLETEAEYCHVVRPYIGKSIGARLIRTIAATNRIGTIGLSKNCMLGKLDGVWSFVCSVENDTPEISGQSARPPANRPRRFWRSAPMSQPCAGA